jgi:hypothetical protein
MKEAQPETGIEAVLPLSTTNGGAAFRRLRFFFYYVPLSKDDSCVRRVSFQASMRIAILRIGGRIFLRPRCQYGDPQGFSHRNTTGGLSLQQKNAMRKTNKSERNAKGRIHPSTEQPYGQKQARPVLRIASHRNTYPRIKQNAYIPLEQETL